MRVRDEKKEQLVIDKAIELFVSGGFEGFSMNKLARLCNISVATLYIYYANKEELIKKIGRDIGDLFFEMSLHNFNPDMSFADGLRVHRSWWIARDAVASIRREGRTATIILMTGHEAGVARDMMPELRASGWL